MNKMISVFNNYRTVYFLTVNLEYLTFKIKLYLINILNTDIYISLNYIIITQLPLLFVRVFQK